MSHYTPEPVTANAVRAYREETGASMMGAKSHLQRQSLKMSLHYLRSLGDLEDKIEWLLDRYEETLENMR